MTFVLVDVVLMATAAAVEPIPSETSAARRRVDVHLGEGPPTSLPVSFTYGGRPAAEKLDAWTVSRSSRGRLDASR